MQNKKVYFIIGGVLLVYLVFMFVFLVIPQMKKDNERAAILFDTSPASYLSYRDGKWENGKGFEDYNWKRFDLYTENQVYQDYTVQYYKDEWYYYKGENQPVKLDSVKIGVHSNFPVEVITYKEGRLTSGDISIIKEKVKDRVSEVGTFTNQQKIIVDVDQDGTNEELLVASNAFYTEDHKKTFSILILRDGNDITVLEEKYFDSATSYEQCTLGFDQIIKAKGNVYLISGCTYFDRIGTKHCMHQVKNGKYERIISC